MEYFNHLLFYASNFCQRSIEDKLSNLSQEKETIKNEIERISPELQKVTLIICACFIKHTCMPNWSLDVYTAVK